MDYSDRDNLQRLFVDSLPDCALVVLDIDGKVLTWNAGAHAMHGYLEAEMIGRHFSCLFTQDDIDAARPLAFLAGALVQGWHEETRLRLHKDGSERKVQDVLISLYDPNRKLVAFGNMTRATDPPVQARPAVDVQVGAVPVPAVKAPAAPAHAQVHAAPAPALRLVPAAGERRRKVLLVDDDEDVRRVAVDLVTGLGYEVIVASSGPEALELLATVTDIDVLFTDVIMPGGMDGGQVAEKARQLRPGVKVLFTSGYFEGALVRKGNIAANTHFLVKPYRRKDLALMVP